MVPPTAGSFFSSNVKYLYKIYLTSTSFAEAAPILSIFKAIDSVIGLVAKLALLIID
jgi:hypothetical protein